MCVELFRSAFMSVKKRKPTIFSLSLPIFSPLATFILQHKKIKRKKTLAREHHKVPKSSFYSHIHLLCKKSKMCVQSMKFLLSFFRFVDDSSLVVLCMCWNERKRREGWVSMCRHNFWHVWIINVIRTSRKGFLLDLVSICLEHSLMFL